MPLLRLPSPGFSAPRFYTPQSPRGGSAIPTSSPRPHSPGPRTSPAFEMRVDFLVKAFSLLQESLSPYCNGASLPLTTVLSTKVSPTRELGAQPPVGLFVAGLVTFFSLGFISTGTRVHTNTGTWHALLHSQSHTQTVPRCVIAPTGH